jgi:pyridoxamine 5'-phosphate oxidase
MIEDIRKSYELDELTEEKAGDDPFLLLRRWLDEALQAEIIEPNAMCLATVDENGNPDARFVLLRGLDDDGAGVLHERQQCEGQAARASIRMRRWCSGGARWSAKFAYAGASSR